MEKGPENRLQNIITGNSPFCLANEINCKTSKL